MIVKLLHEYYKPEQMGRHVDAEHGCLLGNTNREQEKARKNHEMLD